MPSSPSIADRLDSLGVALPPITAPVANYVSAVQSGTLVFLSGHVSARGDGSGVGKLGDGVSVEAGYAAARTVAVALLATLQAHLGSLEGVTRIVKLLGMVNAVPDFTQHPAVINGASDLLVEVFGERGRHARSAVGVGSLPGNAAVEIELVVETGP